MTELENKHKWNTIVFFNQAEYLVAFLTISVCPILLEHIGVREGFVMCLKVQSFLRTLHVNIFIEI